MFRLRGAAEELDAVVRVHVHLDVVDLGPTADALESDAVQLVVRADQGPGELDPDVAEHTGVVVVVVAAVPTGAAFTERFAGDGAIGAGVQGRVAVEDQATPVTAGP